MGQKAADYASEHRALWIELRDRVAKSIPQPEHARYVANSLMEWDEGRDLLRRIVAHIDSTEAS